MSRIDWYIRANLKLRHLELLVALDDLRNVGKVASYLNVSQPAISKTLATIEEGVEVPLFDRTPRGLEPTEHGICLIRHARRVLEQMVAARDELLDITEGRVTRVSLGVLPAAAVLLVPKFIAMLEEKSSEVSASVVEAHTDILLRMLRAGDIDLLVGNLPQRALGAEFETELLYRDPIVVVARHDHPLALAPNLDWEMLNDYPMVLPAQAATTHHMIADALLQRNVALSRRSVESISTLTNVGVLQETDSTGFLSQAVARHFEKLGLLSVLPLDLGNVEIEIGLIWMTDRGLSKAQQLVRTLFRETRDAMRVKAGH
ncbi:HTH-type transcriptional regulator GbpR [compost metagenome]